MLESVDFLNVIDKTPLVSVDLIIEKNSMFLLGKRTNEPAEGYWFMPGGRILKDESIKDALSRILDKETGLDINYDIDNIRFIGVQEHRYNTNTFKFNGVSTHYIVLVYHLVINNSDVASDSQHNDVAWFNENNIMMNPKVHLYAVNNIKLFKTNNKD